MSKRNKILLITGIIAGLLIIIFITAISAIVISHLNNKSSNLNTYYDENGNLIFESHGHVTTTYNSLPAELKYNDKTITLVDIDAEQGYSDYVYTIYVTATFDISNLDDAEIHWLVDEDFSCDAFVTSETNGINFKELNKTNWKHDKTTMVLKFSSEKWITPARHSFDGCEITICPQATQEETFEYTNSEGKVSNLHKTISFHCPKTFETVPQREEKN